MSFTQDERDALKTIKLPRAKQPALSNAVAVLVELGYSRVRVQSHLFAAGHGVKVVKQLTDHLK